MRVPAITLQDQKEGACSVWAGGIEDRGRATGDKDIDFGHEVSNRNEGSRSVPLIIQKVPFEGP